VINDGSRHPHSPLIPQSDTNVPGALLSSAYDQAVKLKAMGAGFSTSFIQKGAPAPQSWMTPLGFIWKI
jgi:hypothetical protein